MDSLLVLVHSPLVGPLTWSLVAERLRQRSIKVFVPVLTDVEGTGAPYWQQHAEAVKQALEFIPQCALMQTWYNEKEARTSSEQNYTTIKTAQGKDGSRHDHRLRI